MSVLRYLTTTLDSKLGDSGLDPQPLSPGDTDLVSTPLSRHSTAISEVSRILTALRDDHEQDVADFERYKSRPVPEETLLEQLDLVDLDAPEQEQEDHPIDGPFAFMQAFLVMLLVFSTWGANAAFGVFLNYYLTSDSFPTATQYDFALMGGIIIFLAQGLAPFSALALKVFGQRTLFMLGVLLQTLGYFLAAQCTQFWQVFICQGVLVGLSFAMIFIPGTLVLPTWFDKQRATAMGIAVSGAGLGGLVFSLALNQIIIKTGDQRWALRAVGFVTFATSLVGCTFLRVRLPKTVPRRIRWSWSFVTANAKVIFDVRVFDNYPLVLVGLWFGVAVLGYAIVLYSISSYATLVGLSHTQSSNILAILNAGQVVGRPIVGNIGDYFGRNNTATGICLFVAILIYAFWINATTYGSLIALAAILGGPVGVGSTMAQSLAADILDKLGRAERLPAAWSGLNIMVAMCSLPSEVIALKLRRPDSAHQYEHTQIFTGSCFVFCMMLLLVNREWLVRKTFEARRMQALESLWGSKGHSSCHMRRMETEEEEKTQELKAEMEEGKIFARNGNTGTEQEHINTEQKENINTESKEMTNAESKEDNGKSLGVAEQNIGVEQSADWDEKARSDSVDTEAEADDELLEARVARYNRLLAPHPAFFFVRMFYPIRV